jgi:hypothetical protein
MASNSHHTPTSSFTMSYYQSSNGSYHGLPLSQSQMGSFNASQSVAPTPSATPPRASQQSTVALSFTNGTQHSSTPRGSFGAYDQTNGYGTGSVQEEYKSQIYRVRLARP